CSKAGCCRWLPTHPFRVHRRQEPAGRRAAPTCAGGVAEEVAVPCAGSHTRIHSRMRIGGPAESAPGERGAAPVPEGVERLAKAGVAVSIQRGAGASAGVVDAQYQEAGATLAPAMGTALADAELVCRVQRPSA